MKIKANLYNVRGGVMVMCPEIDIAARGRDVNEAVKKLRRTLKHFFTDFSIETED